MAVTHCQQNKITVCHFLVRLDHLTFRSVLHWFVKDVVCVQVDRYHEISVAALRGVRERACLVGVDAFD